MQSSNSTTWTRWIVDRKKLCLQDKDAEHHWATPGYTVQKVDKFTYLSKYITGRKIRCEGMKERVKRLRTAYLAIKEVYKKKNIDECEDQTLQGNTDFCMWLHETWSVCSWDDTRKTWELKKDDRKILRKILEQKSEGGSKKVMEVKIKACTVLEHNDNYGRNQTKNGKICWKWTDDQEFGRQCGGCEERQEPSM